MFVHEKHANVNDDKVLMPYSDLLQDFDEITLLRGSVCACPLASFLISLDRSG